MKQKKIRSFILLSAFFVNTAFSASYAQEEIFDFPEEVTARMLEATVAIPSVENFAPSLNNIEKKESISFHFFEESKAKQEEYDLSAMLRIALQPVGKTMYVWGGGWNKEDNGAGKEARSIGLGDQWQEFMKKQTSSYNYKTTRYQIHNGLDCSGYVGWTMYNLFHTRDGEEGYVMKARDMAKNFSSRGWGSFTPSKSVKDYRPGDIMSNATHVYIVLGSCDDGSVVLLHASPPGVQISGTVDRQGKKNSEASRLAKKYMKKYYPEWYRKYPSKTLDKSYLKSYHQMRWKTGQDQILQDVQDLHSMDAEQVLSKLFYEE